METDVRSQTERERGIESPISPPNAQFGILPDRFFAFFATERAEVKTVSMNDLNMYKI